MTWRLVEVRLGILGKAEVELRCGWLSRMMRVGFGTKCGAHTGLGFGFALKVGFGWGYCGLKEPYFWLAWFFNLSPLRCSRVGGIGREPLVI